LLRNTAIFLLSAAIIAYQLVLMQVLSIVQWHHLAFLVISTALLGFGAAGTFLSILREKLLNAYEWLFPCLMFLTATGFILAIPVSQFDPIRFDLFLLFSNSSHSWKLMTTYLLFFLPFFSGALAIGLCFVKYTGQINKLYFSNLLGSSAGGLLAIALMKVCMPQNIPLLIALLPITAGLLLLKNKPPQRKGNFPIGISVSLSVVFAVASIFASKSLKPSQFKDLSSALLLPEATIMLEKSGPNGLVSVLDAPSLRYAPGLSLNFEDTLPVRKAVFVNGNWAGVVAKTPSNEKSALDYSTTALPWLLAKPRKVLLPDAGTGEYVAYALYRGASDITALETNEELVSLLRNELATDNGALFHQPQVQLKSLESRTWLQIDTATYDLILLPDVSSFGGNSGVQALREDYNMTVEAFESMLRKLSNRGILSLNCWLDYPVRYPLKVLATFVEAMKRIGNDHPALHICAIRSWSTITFAAQKTPFSQTQIDSIRKFCEAMSFDPALLPDIAVSERQKYNQLQDAYFFDNLDRLISSKPDSLFSEYAFDIRPATDQRPFFPQFLQWKSLPALAKSIGAKSVPFLELGYLLVIVTFFQLALIAALLIILPLLTLDSGRRSLYQSRIGFWRMLLYFGGIGVGFMFVEIVLIQQFILFLGSPIYATAAVITGLLLFSGIGSYYSPGIISNRRYWRGYLLAIVLMLFVYAFALHPLLLTAASLPFLLKLLLFSATLFPLGFLMGLPFPTGLSRINQQQEHATAWAWAVNGYFSVVSTSLASIIAVELGFLWVMLLAAMAYLVVFVSVWDSDKYPDA
jgi:spermidine synthase